VAVDHTDKDSVLQNMAKKIIDFDAIRQVTRVPVHQVWATN
jgi:hypothetical protein